MTGQRLLLVGMMGAGKTTVGRLLSERTGWPYLDNDELLARAGGMPTPDVLQRQGVTALRAAESAALTAALRARPPVVAGVAAGVVDDAGDRARLAGGGIVVYLRARLETLAARVGGGEGRPWLAGDPQGALRRLHRGRERRYLQVARIVVDVDELAPARVAERILAEVAALPRAAGPAGHPEQARAGAEAEQEGR